MSRSKVMRFMILIVALLIAGSLAYEIAIQDTARQPTTRNRATENILIRAKAQWYRTLLAVRLKKPTEIRVCGDDRMVQLHGAWAEAYRHERPDVFVNVH